MLNGVEYGKVLDYAVVTAGIRELCPDMHFDLGGCLGIWHPRIETLAGVYYLGRHITAIDRGQIPEFKIWATETDIVEISPEKVGSTPGAWLRWRTIEPGYDEYVKGVELAKNYEQGYSLEDGILRHYRGFNIAKRRGRVLKVGWRHTFERILVEEIPGVTRSGIARKFNVDMTLYPVGAPEEIAAQILEE